MNGRMVKSLVVFMFVIGGFQVVAAQNNAVEWYSPRLMSLGAATAGGDAPSSDALNPAASAGNQRTTLDLSYFVIPGLGTETGDETGTGHWINAGVSIPGSLGVLNVSGRFATSPFSATTLGFGTFGGINVGFAKDVLDDLWFGVGLGFQYGRALDPLDPVDGSERDDWGLGLSLGFINLVTEAGILKDFRWGVALRDLGKGMFTPYGAIQESDISFAMPPNFTPAIGTQFKLAKSDEFSLGFNFDLAFPSFQNLQFNAGLEADFLKIFAVQVSYDLDVARLIAGEDRAIPLSFGLSFNISGGATDNVDQSGEPLPFWRTSEFKPTLAAAPIDDGIWAFGIGLNLPIGVIDSKPPLVIMGDPVFDGEDPDDYEFWNDSSEEGQPEEDGEQTGDEQTEGADSGTESSIQPQTFYMSLSGKGVGSFGGGGGEQAESGSGEVTAGSTSRVAYISPNFNGERDVLTLPLNISDDRPISSYSLIVTDNAGKVVRTIRNKEERPETRDIGTFWEQFTRVKTGLTVPRNLVWDGLGDDGAVVPDGTYQYVIEVSDDNKNIARTPPRNVVVDTMAPEIVLNPPADRGFAPGGDRPFFLVDMSSSPEDQWTAVVLDAENKVTRTFKWNRTLPPTFSWDGKNEAGVLAPDGVYSVRITSVDRARNTGTAEVDNILLLNQATPVRISIDNAWFSPNGDSIKDTVSVTVNANEQVQVDSWAAELTNAEGRVVRTVRGSNSLPRSLTVDGMDDTGNRLPEGVYTLRLSALYINGNKPTVESPQINLDITSPRASLQAEYSVFSPNGDGRKDTVRIAQQSSEEVAWKGIIRATGADSSLVEFSWRATPDAALVWDGRDQANAILTDGTYTYQLSATDLAGNFGQSSPLVLQIDNRRTNLTAQVQRGWFSPNGDGISDNQTVELSYDLQDGITEYEVRIIPVNADSGSAVFGSSQSLFSWKGTGKPPAALIWNGTTIDGKKASDGSYQAEASITYTKGDRPITTTRTFVLDTQAPLVSVTVLSPVPVSTTRVIFSPDGDGSQDALTLAQQTSEEQAWTGTFSDSKGTVVKSQSWQGKALPQFAWDGSDNNGNPVPDGEYVYTLDSTDQAGNTARSRIGGIQIDTRPTSVALSIGGTAFSPNGDGIKDSMEFSPRLDQNSDIKTWRLQIAPASGGSARTINGTGQDRVPARLIWDGRTDGNRTAPEGEYLATLSVEYLKGNTAQAQSPKFTLDITPPTATAYPDLTLFSPDGDGSKDKITINQDGSTEPQWTGTIRFANRPEGSADTPIAFYTWVGKPGKTQIWDGANNQGIVVPDGSYVYQLSATDDAGNSGTSSPVSVTVDRRAVTATVKAEQRWLSPNNDSRSDKLTFTSAVSLAEGLDTWQLDIVPSASVVAGSVQSAALAKPIRSIKGTGRLPATIDWDGKTDSGTVAADGEYRGVLTVAYLKGNRPRALSEVFGIDTTAPRITLAAEDLLFSPDGDGLKDFARVKQQSSSEDLWEGMVRDSAGKTVRTFFWRGQTQDLAWDGKDDNGNALPDGRYSYLVKASDKADNVAEQTMAGIVIDTRPTPLLLTASARGFAPGIGRPEVSTIGFRPLIGLRDGVIGWNLSFVHQNGRVEHRLSGQGLPPENIPWDGTKTDKARAAEGRYEAVLIVEYAKGNKPEAKSSPFMLDVTAPNAALALNPKPFSPDEDGVDDELTIGVQVDDPSGIREWELAIYEPTEDPAANPGRQVRPFVTFSGQGQPAGRIVWNGKSGAGELVQAAEEYPMIFSITDTLGNKGNYREIISVDVLVIRDGDILRIRIPGIEFPANSADLNAIAGDKAAKNKRTLDRLAEILRKYGSYTFTVEGHANITQYWDAKLADEENRRELIPLSERRAEAVKAALVLRGIAGSRISTIGVGGGRPVVPNRDLPNVWKNRRVEFILKK